MKIGLLTTDTREVLKDYSTPAPHFGTAPEALIQGFARLPEVEVHVLSCIRQPVNAPAKLAANIIFHSLRVPKIGWMRTAYQGCIRAARRKLKEIRPDIVHGQGTELDCALDAVCSGFRNVLTVHGNMRLIAQVNHARPFSFPWLAARLEQFTIPRSAGVVCISRYTQQAVLDLARRTWVVPNAVDESFFQVNGTPDVEAPARLLCVAHVCMRKNQNAFIRALDPLAKKYRFELKFLGPAGENSAYGREFLSLVKARPWCIYGGWAGREELKAELSRTTMLVLPSLEDNCPMSVLEAMAASVPVLAAKVGGLPDLIQPDKTGFFCNPLDAESMAGAVEKVLVNPAAVVEVARQARKQALERFHPEVIARRHIEVYREVLASAS